MEKNTLQLSGFNAVERMDATISVNKFVDKVKRHVGDFDELIVTKKDVHKAGNHATIEINANLMVGSSRHHGHAEGFVLRDVLNDALASIEAATVKVK